MGNPSLLPFPVEGGGRIGGCGGRLEERGGKGVLLLPHGSSILPHVPQAQRTGSVLFLYEDSLTDFCQGIS